MFHPAIKLTAEYFAHFFDKNVIDRELKTYLFVKPTDTHQFLGPVSSIIYHYKKGIPTVNL